MANCSARFNVILSFVALGFMLCHPGVSIGADAGPSLASSEGHTKVALLYVGPGRADTDTGPGPDERWFRPSIAVSEEYTDNVFATHWFKKSDFITHVSPGIELRYWAPFWEWNLKYLLDFRYYANHSRDYEFNHTLDTKGSLRIIKNLLFLDVRDTYKRISLDVNRDTTADSSFVNQADQNILTVSPRIELRPSASVMVTAGYNFIMETYSNPYSTVATGIPAENARGINKDEHDVYVRTTYELSPKTTLFSNLMYSFVDAKQSQSSFFNTGQNSRYHRFLPTVGIRYQFAEKSFASLEGGCAWVSYQGGEDTTRPYWNAAVTHSFDHFTLSANALVAYNTDPLRGSTEERIFTGRLEKALERGVVYITAGYSQLRDDRAERLVSERIWTGTGIRHQLTEKLTGHLDLIGEHVNYKYSDNINNDTTTPYRLQGATGLSYLLAEKLTAFLDYSYTTYRRSISSADNNVEINRVFLGVKKVF